MQELPLNKVLVGDNRKIMAGLPSDSIDLVVTSPPYWGLRDYGMDGVIWGGDPLCDHVFNEQDVPQRGNRDQGFNERWGNSAGQKKQETKNKINAKRGECIKCGSWKGQLGLEPNPQMFVDHILEISRGIKRIIKPSGSFWLNLGDSYYGSGKGAGTKLEDAKEVYIMDKASVPKQSLRSNWLQPKQLLGMPWRVAIALQEDGWILRNCVIWFKRNHMPEPVQDRLTKSYEFFFFFVKSRKYYFDLDSIRVPKIHNEPWSLNANKKPYESNNPRLNYDKDDKKGKNPGDVWDIPTQPFPGAHFAVFPPSLIEPIIKSSSPEGGIVLDPFAGSGTALRVARKFRRSFIGIELNPEYATMAEERVRSDKYSPAPGVKKLTAFSKSLRINEK